MDPGGIENKIEFPNPRDRLTLRYTVKPPSGYWKGGLFHFTITLGPEYPIKPPKVRCDTPVYHPNIDDKGNVCLNILRDVDWRPVLELNHVMIGLQFLFIEPEPNDPLNKEAALVFRENISQFERNVSSSLRGETVAGRSFRQR